MHPFGRVLTAMITPFTSDGAVDHETAFRLARHLVDNGSDGLVVCGTTGESPTLSADEKVAVFATVKSAVGERARVVAGTGTYDTAESVELSKRAAEVGADGLLAVTPYYSKPEQRGLLAHFTAIADATDLDVLLYNIPGRTARLIEIPTLAALAEHDRIVAVKDAVMDIDHTSEVCRTIPGLAVYSGQDSFTLPMMSVGATGVVSVISHLAGRQVREMVDAALAGEIARARQLHQLLLPLCWACFMESNPGPVRSAMNRWWEPVGPPRLPVLDATDATLTAVETALIHLQEHS
ncbi:MAG TPA: 4-hydroxy-tetrahydrodipicolinate synthase [Acidimicrobiia bacterium]|nr:4-hydroxy-tetrahydrodipicolinate synthase [Acidimicrobiia bacterium]